MVRQLSLLGAHRGGGAVVDALGERIERFRGVEVIDAKPGRAHDLARRIERMAASVTPRTTRAERYRAPEDAALVLAIDEVAPAADAFARHIEEQPVIFQSVGRAGGRADLPAPVFGLQVVGVPERAEESALEARFLERLANASPAQSSLALRADPLASMALTRERIATSQATVEVLDGLDRRRDQALSELFYAQERMPLVLHETAERGLRERDYEAMARELAPERMAAAVALLVGAMVRFYLTEAGRFGARIRLESTFAPPPAPRVDTAPRTNDVPAAFTD